MAQLIVTRPSGQEQSLVAGLQQQGHDVLTMPLMRIVPQSLDTPGLDAQHQETQRLRQCFMDLDSYHKVISISANATRFGLDAMDIFWPQFPVGIHWFAVGPSSADHLIQSGLDARIPAARFDSDGLLSLPELQQVEDEKILIWRGVGGREVLAKTLRERGASVDYAELYCREEQHYSQQHWQDSLQQMPWLLLSSGQALQIVEQQVPDLPQRVAGLVLPSQRVADQARNRNYHQVLVPASARDDDVLTCIQDSL